MTDASKKSYDTARQAQATDALAPRTLDQRYSLESKIGEGGMGTVYRARRLAIGDLVAVKILHPEQLANPNAVERFRREAQAAARLKHPNVVTIHDFGVSKEGLVYLVMELVEGESLRRVIERQGTLVPATAAEVARQVCAALDEAHRQGIIHRDIKPDNILLQTAGLQTASNGLSVKVLDFGVAALHDITATKLTRAGSVVGTPHYMSPEQCMGEELDGRSDIYNFGVVLYEMLTGVVPFNSPTPTAIVVQQVNQAPPPMRDLNADIPPQVEAVVLRALKKQREARPQTAGDLAREMMSAVGGRITAPSALAITQIHPVAASAPDSGAKTPLSVTPISSGNVESAANRGGRLALLALGAILALAVIGALGYRWYASKNKTGQAIGAASSQQPATVTASGNSQPAAANQIAPGNVSKPPATSPQPSSGKLWQLIPDQTNGATGAENVLGAPDQQVATIAPGGQIALAYLEGRLFGDGDGADLRVFGPSQSPVSYRIFVRNDPASAWQRIDTNRRSIARTGAGHDIGHHGVRQARQVMIKNDGAADLQIDAVTAIYRDVAGSVGRPHRHR
ncbi:MAG: serine/threonine-protein kinase [Blastocatellales bacterium]